MASHQKIDLSGQKFGNTTVISRSCEKKFGTYPWVCQCDCGKFHLVYTANLVKGRTRSCGCLRAKTVGEGKWKIKHGMYKTPEYKVWASMIDRCENQKSQGYIDYGGRGIKVCERWRNSFQEFFNDMGARPSKKHSIDRKDTNGNYEPGNCRWATMDIQMNNKRTNVFVEIDGETMTVSQACRKTGKGPVWVRNRFPVVNRK